MKRLGFICLIFVFAITAGCGQPRNKAVEATSTPPQGGPQMREQGPGPGQEGRRQFSPEDFANRQTEQIGEYITFTEGQKEKVYQLNLKYSQKMQELRSGVSFMDMNDEQRAEMRKKMDAQQAEKDQEMKTILSAEQMTAYEKFREEMRNRMQRRPQ